MPDTGERLATLEARDEAHTKALEKIDKRLDEMSKDVRKVLIGLEPLRVKVAAGAALVGAGVSVAAWLVAGAFK